MRTGAEYRDALRDGRKVWVMGAGPVEDVTTHPATRAIVEQAGGRAIAAAADVALPESALAVVEAAITEFGHVEVLVNNRSHPPT